MLSIIKSLASKETQARQAAQKRYAQLLFSGKEDPATEKELAALMTTLGKSSRDLADDYQVATRWHELSRTVTENAATDEQVAAAEQAVQESAENVDKAIEGLRAGHRLTVEKSRDLQFRRSLSENAERDAETLRQSRPDLFGHLAL